MSRKPNIAASPNRRPCFAFAVVGRFGYSFCEASLAAAVGEPQR
jgi:hypothetical protein